MNKYFQWYHYVLVIIFLIFLFLHIYRLPRQEFVGDEASPMLYIDRMWDGVQHHDIRFLAYPFLFYNDPFRGVIGGTILHFFGPDRVLTRLPNIFFAFATFWFLVWIFEKEKIAPFLIIGAMTAYAISGLVMNSRIAGGDSQGRFLILLTGYSVWKALEEEKLQGLKFGIWAWLVGMLTMLDTIALLPSVLVATIKLRAIKEKPFRQLLFFTFFLLAGYFFLWLLLPYLAYKSGFQQHYLNRGLFYYFSRTGEGASSDPWKSVRALKIFTSAPFAIWLIATSLFGIKIKKMWNLQLITLPAWILVFLLNRSSFHIIMYSALFFWQAVIVTNFLWKKIPKLKILIAVSFCIFIVANIYQLYSEYLTNLDSSAAEFSTGHLDIPQKGRGLDDAVVRIYHDHNEQPLISFSNDPQ